MRRINFISTLARHGSQVKRQLQTYLRFVAILLISFTVIDVSAQESDIITIDGVKYYLIYDYYYETSTAIVDGFEPGIVTANIPSTITTEYQYFVGNDNQGQPIYDTRLVTFSVTTIGDEAFKDCKTLTNVIIGDSVTYIDYESFAGCTALESLTIGVSVDDVNWRAFSGCAPTELVYLAKHDVGLSTIGYMSFENIEKVTIGRGVEDFSLSDYDNYCHPKELIWNARRCITNGNMVTYDIESLTIGDDVEVLPNNFLRGTNFETVTIPSSVREIGTDAFAGCTNLALVDISDLSAWCKIIFHGISNSSQEFSNYWDDVDYPDYGLCRSNPLSNGASLYLNGQRLTKLVIPDDITTVNDGAFSGCSSFTQVTIGDNVTSIGACSFDHCAHLTTLVDIGNGVTTIGHDAFAQTPVREVTIGKALTHIARGAFSYVLEYENDGEYSYDNSISRRAVTIYDLEQWCNITFEDISSNPLYVGAWDIDTYTGEWDQHYSLLYHKTKKNGIWSTSRITSLKNLNSIQRINDYAFAMCGTLETVDSLDCINEIGKYAFYSCLQLKSLKLPNTITSISDHAFALCYSLNKIIIPASVTYIGEMAFNNAAAVEDLVVTCYADTPPELYDYTSLEFASFQKALYVPKNSVDIYKSTSIWKDFFNPILPIEEEIPVNPADLNGDGSVNIGDMSVIIDIILRGSTDSSGLGDLNGDGVVNITDLNAIINFILSH